MDAPFADAVYPILERGLNLRARLAAGEEIAWDRERPPLEAMLADLAASPTDTGDLEFILAEPGGRTGNDRLTRNAVHLALRGWLDETFAPERFAGDEERAEFWEQARYAETRRDNNALEAMLLCVMLGFRGARRDQAAQLEAWATRVRAVLAQSTSTWTMPPGLDPSSPAAGADGAPLRRMAFSVLLAFALMVPLAAAAWWRWYSV
jgi:hypothetical protein